MSKTLLTQEEVEKRKELFEYEMTEVILNLKGKFAKFDREKSPLKDSALTESDFNCKPDYVPLSGIAVKNEKFTVPAVSKQVGYKPLDVAIPGFSAKVPVTLSEVDYSPIVSKKPLENGFVVPAMPRSLDYIPVEGAVLKSFIKKVLPLGEAPAFKPTAVAEIPTVEYSLPDAINDVDYKPFKAVVENSMAGYSLPDAINDVDYKPFKAVAENSMAGYSFPDAIGDTGYEPFEKEFNKAILIDVPAISNISMYSPFEATEITGEIVDVPVRMPEISFTPFKKTKAVQKRIKYSATAQFSDYVPRKKVAVSITTQAVPKLKFKVLFTAITADEKAVDMSKIQYAKEVTQIKDFYSIWATL